MYRVISEVIGQVYVKNNLVDAIVKAKAVKSKPSHKDAKVAVWTGTSPESIKKVYEV